MPKSELHLYEINDGEETYLIADESEEQAMQSAAEAYCLADCLPQGEALTVRQVPDDKSLTIGSEEPWEVEPPEGCTVGSSGADPPSWTATARDWAEWAGAGVLVGGTLW